MFKIRFVNEGYEVILYMFGPWIQHTCYFLDRSGRSIFLFNLVSEKSRQFYCFCASRAITTIMFD